MKKLTMIFSVLAIMAGTSAFANSGEKVSKTVQTAFQKNFSGAVNVTWDVSDEFYFASFELNGKKTDAAYNEKGELLGYSKRIGLSDLPLSISESLKKGYPGYAILNTVTEIEYEGQTFYYATVLGATKVLKLKCLPDGDISVESRIKK